MSDGQAQREAVVITSLADYDTWAESRREPEPTRACSKCTAEHPASHFQPTGRGRPFSRCDACRQVSPEETRRSNLQRMYGITVEEYDGMRATQSFCCAICKRHEDELPTKKVGRPRLDGQPSAEPMKLHVDHDHATGAIRGLLCGSCNSGIAHFQDQVDRMANAITYINDRRTG